VYIFTLDITEHFYCKFYISKIYLVKNVKNVLFFSPQSKLLFSYFVLNFLHDLHNDSYQLFYPVFLNYKDLEHFEDFTLLNVPAWSYYVYIL